MTQPKSFVLYDDYFELIKFLTVKQRGELITMIFQYAETGEEMKHDDTAVRIVFSTIRMAMDRDREKYIQRCEANKENGKKGGRPKKIEKTERFFEKPKKPYNENENDNENDNEIDIENGGENENENENGYESGSWNENDRAPRRMGSLSPSELPPPLSEKDREELQRLGIPESYAEERIERAALFARSQKKRVVEVLSEWWQTDRYGTPQNQRKQNPWQLSSENKSYDTEDFFQAALRRSEEEAEREYQEWLAKANAEA